MTVLKQNIMTTIELMSGLERMFVIRMNKEKDLVAHIAFPPPHGDVSVVQASDFQIQEVILGKPTKDIAKAMTTLGLKHILRQLDEGEEEIQFLRKQNEVLVTYIKEVVGPIDSTNPKITLKDDPT